MLFLAVCLKDPASSERLAYEAAVRHTWAAHDGTVWRRVCRTSDRLALFAAESRTGATVGASLEEAGDRIVLAPYAAVLPEGTRPEDAAATALPPYLRLEADLAAGSLRLDGDWLGLARGFYLDGPDVLLVSNRLDLLRQAARRHLPLDEEALACFAATGWFTADTTPLAGVRTLPPGASFSFRPRPGRRCEPELARRPMPLVTPGEGPVTPALVEEATAGLTATARRIGALGGPIDLALSGGKDSRLLAAAFFEAGVEARLYTRAVYDDEAAIAVELVRRLGPGRVRHDIVGHGDTAGGFSFSDVPVDPLASARYLVSFSGGLYDPVHVGQLDAGGLGTPGVSGTPTVHGGLGEIAHNIYYPAGTSPEEERDDRLLERKLVRRVVRKGTLTRWAGRAARDAAGRVFAAGRAHGFAGVRLYDWFWLFERYRRMNPVPAYFDHLLPFADIGFVNAALSVDISEHRAHRLHRELTAALVPRWRDVPYFKPAAGSARAGARPRRGRRPRRSSRETRTCDGSSSPGGSRRPPARWRPGRRSGRTGTSSSGPSGSWRSGPSSATGRSAGPAAPSVSGRAWPRSGASRDAGAGLSGSDDSGTRGAGRRREPRASDAGPRP